MLHSPLSPVRSRRIRRRAPGTLLAAAAVAILTPAAALAWGGAADTTQLVSAGAHGVPASNASFGAGISSTGRYVAFTSYADDLVPGDTNHAVDLFVRDRANRHDDARVDQARRRAVQR